MKAKNLSSKVEATPDGFVYTLINELGPGRESIPVDLASLVPGWASMHEFVQKALRFGIRTRLRNETAGATFEDARIAIRDALTDFSRGVWASARSIGGEGRTSPLVEAIVRASAGKYDAMTAAELVNSKIAAVASSKGVDPEAEDDESREAMRKIRNAVRAAFLEKKSVAAAYAQVQSERAAEAAQRKAEKAAKATAAAADVSDVEI